MTYLAKTGLVTLMLASACGSGNPTRYLVAESAAPASPQRLSVSTVELRDVVLPAYGADAAILLEEPEGGLKALRGVEWADSSVEAVTAELARRLDGGGTAAVAAEPWPLSEPAQVRLEVRIGRVVAARDGRFLLEGQFAVASQSDVVRESLERFKIAVPMPAPEPGAIATAYGQALDELSTRILRRLSR